MEKSKGVKETIHIRMTRIGPYEISVKNKKEVRFLQKWKLTFAVMNEYLFRFCNL